MSPEGTFVDIWRKKTRIYITWQVLIKARSLKWQDRNCICVCLYDWYLFRFIKQCNNKLLLFKQKIVRNSNHCTFSCPPQFYIHFDSRRWSYPGYLYRFFSHSCCHNHECWGCIHQHLCTNKWNNIWIKKIHSCISFLVLPKSYYCFVVLSNKVSWC